jgi:hypothetical protein
MIEYFRLDIVTNIILIVVPMFHMVARSIMPGKVNQYLLLLELHSNHSISVIQLQLTHINLLMVLIKCVYFY